MEGKIATLAVVGVLVGAGIGVVIVAPGTVLDAAGRLTGAIATDGTAASGGFAVTLHAAGVGTQIGNVASFSGCDMVIVQARQTVGSDGITTTTPGQKFVEECALSIALPLPRPIADWVNAVVTGKDWSRDVSVVRYNADGTPGRSVLYGGAFVTKVEFPQVTYTGAPAYATIKFKAQRAELDAGVAGTGKGSLPWDGMRYHVSAPELGGTVLAVSGWQVPIDVRETTTGVDWDWRKSAPGDAHYGNITFTLDATAEKTWRQWWIDTSSGKVLRKTITVSLLNREGATIGAVNLHEAFPTEYASFPATSPAGTNLPWTITITVGRIEMV